MPLVYNKSSVVSSFTRIFETCDSACSALFHSTIRDPVRVRVVGKPSGSRGTDNRIPLSFSRERIIIITFACLVEMRVETAANDFPKRERRCHARFFGR